MIGSNLWTPNGVTHTDITDIVPLAMKTDRPQANVYKFTFRYKGKEKQVWVASHMDATLSEIEDRAGAAATRWMQDLDQEEYKRAPTDQEKKDIGKALNEFYLAAKKRRASSNGRLYYEGIN